MALKAVLELSTNKRCELVDITHRLQKIIDEHQIAEGICTLFCPHTTAAVTVNENADPDVAADLLASLERAVPNTGFRHSEGNSDAHVKASLIGPAVTLLIQNRKIQLGTWQGVYFCEFDGPRSRRCWLQTLP